MDYLAPASNSWCREQCRHLLRRAGFGSTPRGADYYSSMSLEKAVETMIEGALQEPRPAKPDDIPEFVDLREARSMLQGLSEEERRRKRNEWVRENRMAVKDLELWWLERMLTSAGFLREKMTLFWHGHFATSAEKVKSAAANWDMYHRLWTYALASFRDLTVQVAKSPAMLQYLDNAQNRKNSPNENFARELFELFTLGIGNYTEQDIKEAARCFAGWQAREGRFFANPRQMDTGRKTVFGQPGKFDGVELIDLVMKQPAMPRWIAGKIWSFFAYENPEPDLVDELAAAFLEERLIVGGLLRRIFMSRAFYSERAMHSRIKSPAEFVVRLQMDTLARWQQPRLATLSMRALGQELFFPPNVKGWPGGKTWINSNTLLLRVNIANYFVNGLIPDLSGQLGRRAQQALQRRRGESMDEGMMANDGMMQRRGSANPTESDDPRSLEEGTDDPMPSRQVRPPLELERFLDSMEAENPEELVDACIDRFLAVPIDSRQREALIAEVRKLRYFKIGRVGAEDEKHLRAMIHMILSMAEYQLC